MTPGQVLSANGEQVLVSTAWRADGAIERMRGLLGRAPLAPDQGLLLRPCASVHTLFMRYALDVVFLGRDGTVRKVVEQLKPWRGAGCLGASAALELLGGSARRSGIEAGRRLTMRWEDTQ